MSNIQFIRGILYSLFYCNISDIFLSKTTGLNRKAKWYLIHSICNLFILIHSFNDMMITFTNPIQSFTSDNYNSKGLEIVVGLHLYHIMRDAYILDYIDWCHHLISCFFMSMIGFVCYHNPTFNSGLFFMCGLPGCIDYFLLFLVKINLFEKLSEKKINVFLNNWIRCPGILYSVSVANVGYMMGYIDMHPLIYLMSQILVIFNAIFFAERVTLNYGYYLDLSEDE